MSTNNFKYEPPSKATLVILAIVTALQAAANWWKQTEIVRFLNSMMYSAHLSDQVNLLRDLTGRLLQIMRQKNQVFHVLRTQCGASIRTNQSALWEQSLTRDWSCRYRQVLASNYCNARKPCLVTGPPIEWIDVTQLDSLNQNNFAMMIHTHVNIIYLCKFTYWGKNRKNRDIDFFSR